MEKPPTNYQIKKQHLAVYSCIKAKNNNIYIQETICKPYVCTWRLVKIYKAKTSAAQCSVVGSHQQSLIQPKMT